MANEYKSITEGVVLVAIIGFWDYLLDWLRYRYAAFARFVRPPPVLLIRNGRLMRQNMKKEMITEQELMSQLREQGIEDPREVRRCYLEGDGHLSVCPAKRGPGKRSWDRVGSCVSVETSTGNLYTAPDVYRSWHRLYITN